MLHGGPPPVVQVGHGPADTGGEIDQNRDVRRPGVGVDRFGQNGQVDVAPGPTQLSEGRVAGDAHGPRVERTAVAVKAGGMAPHALKGLLHDVVGSSVTHDAAPDGPHRGPQPGVHRRQGLAAAGRHVGHHSFFVHLGRLSGQTGLVR